MSGPASGEPIVTTVTFIFGCTEKAECIKPTWLEFLGHGNDFSTLHFSGHGLQGLPIPSLGHESGSRRQDLERAHCEFLNVDYPPAFNQIGKEQFDRAIARQMLLTDKQLDVARLVASGFDNGEVAAQLGITVEGVKKHVAAVMRKSKVDRRAKIVRWFVGL
jgi:DNA-binding CsgD family transcriptional regulator